MPFTALKRRSTSSRGMSWRMGTTRAPADSTNLTYDAAIYDLPGPARPTSLAGPLPSASGPRDCETMPMRGRSVRHAPVSEAMMTSEA